MSKWEVFSGKLPVIRHGLASIQNVRIQKGFLLRLKEEILDHDLTKRKSARLVAECEKRKIVYSIPKPDNKLLKAENDIDDLR